MVWGQELETVAYTPTVASIRTAPRMTENEALEAERYGSCGCCYDARSAVLNNHMVCLVHFNNANLASVQQIDTSLSAPNTGGGIKVEYKCSIARNYVTKEGRTAMRIQRVYVYYV